MKEALIVLLKGLVGGSLVVAFALLSEALEPKRFAGLFGAAPAIAIPSLAIVLITKGRHDAQASTVGMLAGCLGMLCYALATIGLLRSRLPPIACSAVGMLAWVASTAGLAAVLL